MLSVARYCPTTTYYCYPTTTAYHLLPYYCILYYSYYVLLPGLSGCTHVSGTVQVARFCDAGGSAAGGVVRPPGRGAPGAVGRHGYCTGRVEAVSGVGIARAAPRSSTSGGMKPLCIHGRASLTISQRLTHACNRASLRGMHWKRTQVQDGCGQHTSNC